MQGIVLRFRANTCQYLLIILFEYLIITVWHIRVCIYLPCHCMSRALKIKKKEQATLSDQAAPFCSRAGLWGAENVQDKMVHMRSVRLDRLDVHHSCQPAASVLLLKQSFQALAHTLSPPPPRFSL